MTSHRHVVGGDYASVEVGIALRAQGLRLLQRLPLATTVSNLPFKSKVSRSSQANIVMKSTFAVILGCVVATATGTAVAEPVAATEPITASASRNASNTTSGNGMSTQALILKCVQPNGGANPFWRLTKGDGPHTCHVPPLASEWAMLRSYRDGGIQNVHWKYTDNENDQECLKDWTYHAADGRTVKAKISGRTTTFGLGRRWCGLPVYNDGGVQGYQWDYCKCFFVDDGGADGPI